MIVDAQHGVDRATPLMLFNIARLSSQRMAIRVECYAGYRDEQEPTAFWLGERRLAVRAIIDRWFAPTQRWFKIDADDGDMYVLRHDETTGAWEIAAYRAGAG